MISPNPEVAGSPSEKQCPVCLQPLWSEPEGGQVWLYCPHGSCPSSAMNDGALADTVELAFKKLEETSYRYFTD